jgi:hypothetical protein
MPVILDELVKELGYPQSGFYHETVGNADASVAHLLRDAQRAHVRGSYFIRTTEVDKKISRERPVVHVAEAKTPAEAREIHRLLWNQGTTPFLLVSLPGQVRVYTSFAYDPDNEKVGQVEKPIDTTSLSLCEVASRLDFLRADSINSGDIWQTKGQHLTKDKRIDRSLLRTLSALSGQLISRHGLERRVAHALIGRFVYLHYLWERKILSPEWLAAADIDSDAVFSANAKLNTFRRLAEKVDARFNGHIFPIDWSAPTAPNADAIKAVAAAFAGEDPSSRQMHLAFPAYDFSFIPIELLSAIYEQFLHDEQKGEKDGAFYTSEPVADYLIAEIESVKRLERGMTVLDPCCGSGIFLVLAYRRLVEQELRHRKTDHLLPTELRDILTSSIFGVERNPEACLVTEFSLILTLLSYVDPPELHRHQKFQFPMLHNQQIFECDFFDDHSDFWKTTQHFDCVVGNPPWVELDPSDKENCLTVEWIQSNQHSKSTPVARYRSSEAFTWRVCERLADGGVVGLIAQATSLTNDQSADYRKAFFTRNEVHRVTNFSNLAYILFESADEPAATLVYSLAGGGQSGDIIHFGPLVVNQPATMPRQNRRRRTPWVLTICESEIQTIPVADAVQGKATTWKRALWGNPRDKRAIERLKRILPTTLEQIANKRNWHLNLGLQLRDNSGSKTDPNQSVVEIKLSQGALEHEAKEFAEWFSRLKVVEPKQFPKMKTRLTVQSDWVIQNRRGTFIRKGRDAGLDIIRAPHVLLWNDFAAFSDEDFIFRHPKLGLSAPPSDEDWLRAVSVIWTSSVSSYCLFLDLSASWGISRSTIDLGDARQMPMPNLDDTLVAELAKLHRSLAGEESNLDDRTDWQRRLDEGVASILKIPSQVMLLAREFGEFRLPLVKGKAPRGLTSAPDEAQLANYARRLKAELDGFLERKSRRHQVTVLNTPAGIIATVELVSGEQGAKATVKTGKPEEQKDVRRILQAAEKKYSQWAYVRRSARIFTGGIIHVCKPARRLEWTETQALLDAADIIAEVAEARRRHA